MENRGIAVTLFREPRHYMVGGQHVPATFTPLEKLGTHCTEGWVGLGAGLDRCGKSRPHRDSIKISKILKITEIRCNLQHVSVLRKPSSGRIQYFNKLKI
jgi:hypothetical protein